MADSDKKSNTIAPEAHFIINFLCDSTGGMSEPTIWFHYNVMYMYIYTCTIIIFLTKTEVQKRLNLPGLKNDNVPVGLVEYN